MSSRDSTARIDAVCEAIRAHLKKRPRAADTAKGIGDYWVPAELQHNEPHIVEAALQRLVDEGVLVATTLPDGGVVYRIDRRRTRRPTRPRKP
jgi:hypothetical protein